MLWQWIRYSLSLPPSIKLNLQLSLPCHFAKTWWQGCCTHVFPFPLPRAAASLYQSTKWRFCEKLCHIRQNFRHFPNSRGDWVIYRSGIHFATTSAIKWKWWEWCHFIASTVQMLVNCNCVLISKLTFNRNGAGPEDSIPCSGSVQKGQLRECINKQLCTRWDWRSEVKKWNIYSVCAWLKICIKILECFPLLVLSLCHLLIVNFALAAEDLIPITYLLGWQR